uniref:Transmembrane protein n=1 Tax=Opuntia streptacantha TaxID=393608 RepID=A0A7C9D0M9_OPUST
MINHILNSSIILYNTHPQKKIKINPILKVGLLCFTFFFPPPCTLLKRCSSRQGNTKRDRNCLRFLILLLWQEPQKENLLQFLHNPFRNCTICIDFALLLGSIFLICLLFFLQPNLFDEMPH